MLSFSAILLRDGASNAVGIFSDYYPARQASLLEPVMTLKLDYSANKVGTHRHILAAHSTTTTCYCYAYQLACILLYLKHILFTTKK